MKRYPAFASLLNKHLQAQERSANWLAIRLQLHASTVIRWLNEDTRPSGPKIIERILESLAIDSLEERRAFFAAAEYIYQETSTDAASLPDSASTIAQIPPTPVQDFIAYDDRYWVGRETLISDLRNQLLGARRLVVLVGMAGIGKTALAERLSLELKTWLDTSGQPAIYRLNFDHQENQTSFASVAAKWLEERRQEISPEERRAPERLLKQLINTLSGRRCLVIIDSAEKALTASENHQGEDFVDPWWEKFFQSVLSAEIFQSRIILTSQDLPVPLARVGSQYPNRWLRQPLHGLSEAEQIELFQKAGLAVRANSLEYQYLVRIGKIYAGHPLALRTIVGEIVNDFDTNVLMYWRKFGYEIERVEQDMLEASQSGKVESGEDNWRLDRYSVELQRQVRYRLEGTFQRLSQHAHDAYLLLCTVSGYRTPVREQWWLEHLELGEGYTPDRQQAALQALRDRYLIEESIDAKGNRQLGLHNLIRSIAIEHRRRLFPEE